MLIYVIVYSLINYYIGLKISETKYKKSLFRTGIIINLSQLVILKYASFTIDPIFKVFNSDIMISRISEILIPVGISYFTLQGIGYLINVKMAWEKPEQNFLNFLLYITFYPRFLSGPIERSNHFLPQLRLNQVFNQRQIFEGLSIVLFGIFKKVAIANQLAPYVINVYADLNSADSHLLWILFFIVPVYLYFDFSGYTDIAIGLAKTFGIELLPNFNRPFFAENVTNFWKRFHMSLSFWFNDYVFRQISFKNRKWGIYASIWALFTTWILFGIWHGAGWNFMVLGLLQALAINYEFFTKKWRIKLFAKLPVYFKVWLGRTLTYWFYCVSLVFFFAPNLNSAFIYFSKLFENYNQALVPDLNIKPLWLLLFISVPMLLELLQNDYKHIFNKLEQSWHSDTKGSRIIRWTIYYLIIAIIFVLGEEEQHFIYFQF